MNKDLIYIYLSLQNILGKGKRKNKITSTDVTALMPCFVDILSNDNESALATRLQAIVEEYQSHLAVRILDNRQTTLEDQLFNNDNDNE